MILGRGQEPQNKVRNGTVEFGGYGNTGPGGVAFLWAHQAGCDGSWVSVQKDLPV